jgi:hypothetical protein
MLRRYLMLTLHAEDLLHASLGDPTPPAPAEAVAVLDDLIVRLEPIVRTMPAATRQPRPLDIAETVAGWVH